MMTQRGKNRRVLVLGELTLAKCTTQAGEIEYVDTLTVYTRNQILAPSLGTGCVMFKVLFKLAIQARRNTALLNNTLLSRRIMVADMIWSCGFEHDW